jgi:hypothetical protein
LLVLQSRPLDANEPSRGSLQRGSPQPDWAI